MSTEVAERRRAFDAIVCMCDHVYGRHPWYDNPRGTRSHGWCLDCSCTRRRDKEVHEAAARRRALAADPNHVHGSTHIVYACPGFIPMRICDECDTRVDGPSEASRGDREP